MRIKEIKTPSKINFQANPTPSIKNPSQGFLIDHSQFSDAQPPRMRGAARYEKTPSIGQPVKGP